jgi:hypothetical protein
MLSALPLSFRDLRQAGAADVGGVPLFEMRSCGACEISVLQSGKVAKGAFVGNLAVFL